MDLLTAPLIPRTGSAFIAPDIHILRMNTDKTRRWVGSNTEYQIFFEISGTPTPEWRAIFIDAWKKSGSVHHTDLDGPFLVLFSPIEEMTQEVLTLLENTFATTNEVYHRFASDEVKEAARREKAWSDERKTVEAVAAALHFR